MSDAQAVISSSHEAVDAFIKAARAIPASRWKMPRATGKWSPGQVTEHVTLTYEQGRRMLAGTYVGQVEPRYRQLLARFVFLPWLFSRKRFGKGLQAPDFIRPGELPASSGVLLARLESAASALEADLAAAADGHGAEIDHPIFGHLYLADMLRFLAIHTDHHRPQLQA